jgi:hypothetical protein
VIRDPTILLAPVADIGTQITAMQVRLLVSCGSI